MDWNTYYNFPISFKRWLIKRIEKEITKAQEAQSDIPSKAPHHNTPDVRSLTGKTRSQVPHNLQRFT
jgi:hypothetical protein